MAGYPPDYSNSGFRYFSKPFNTQHAVQSFNLQWDPSLVWYNGEKLSTGGWKPLTAGPVAITGGSINIGNNVTIGNTVTTNSTVTPNTAAVVSNDGVSGVSQTVFPSNSNRRAWFIQNLHTGGLMVRLSASMPTTGNLNFILNGGTVVNDGKGEMWKEFPAFYTGPVTVSGLGQSPVLYAAWQI